MSTVLKRTFRVTFDVKVTVRPIDDELIAKLHRLFKREANDPEQEAWIERNRRLLSAVLANPELLQALLLRRAIESLDPLLPTPDGSLQRLTDERLSDIDLLERVRPRLPREDAAFYHDVIKEDLFFDNSMYFQDAWQTEHSAFRIEPLPEETGEEG